MMIGEIYRLKFPSFGWVRVLPNPPETCCWMDGKPAYLVETIFTKDRWWVTAEGRPNNHRSPWLAVPTVSSTPRGGEA